MANPARRRRTEQGRSEHRKGGGYSAPIQQGAQYTGQCPSVIQSLMGIHQRRSQGLGQSPEATGQSQAPGQGDGVYGLQVQCPEVGTLPFSTQKSQVKTGVMGHWNTPGELVGQITGNVGEAGGILQPSPSYAVDVCPTQVVGAGIHQGGPLPRRGSITLDAHHGHLDDPAVGRVQAGGLHVEAGKGRHGPTVAAG